MVQEDISGEYYGFELFAAPFGTAHNTFPRFEKARWDIDNEEIWNEVATAAFCSEGFDLAAWREQPYLIVRVDELWLRDLRAGG